LGASQLVIMGAGVLTVLFALSQVDWPLWGEAYARAYALPRMEERWGFRLGTIRVQRGGDRLAPDFATPPGEYYGIISLTPYGRLARIGLRLHDVTAGLTLYQALLASERGEAATFFVLNLDDWKAGREDFRPIHVQAAR
jgi:hypothetical protein